jgi:hypothetical protein
MNKGVPRKRDAFFICPHRARRRRDGEKRAAHGASSAAHKATNVDDEQLISVRGPSVAGRQVKRPAHRTSKAAREHPGAARRLGNAAHRDAESASRVSARDAEARCPRDSIGMRRAGSQVRRAALNARAARQKV